MRRPRKRRRIAATFVVALLLAALVVGWIQLPAIRNSSFMQHRAANDAIKALKDGDLAGVEKRLAANRGEPDFAYFFATHATPRVLGDALGSVAGEKEGELNRTVDVHKYELTLTDLAGTLALATHGTGDRALPATWASGFAAATTTPDTSKTATQERDAQDQADKQNLLLLLARGYWSVDFLQTVTKAYWTYDHDKGDKAWPGTKADDAKYAPAPNGTYLTDGILALTAALTANPAAGAWAFTDFQPGTQSVEYDGDDHALGNFSHFLFFEHQFPKSSDDDGKSLGMTATLTALSSAIDAEGGPTAVQNAADTATADLVQPMADSRILQGLAKSYNASSDCSWNPLDYGHCVVAAAKWLWEKIKHWGHTVLSILSLASFVPPPFDAIGVAAAVTNATWYAVEGDYAEAGLALVAAVPGLPFAKIAKAGAETAALTKGAQAAVGMTKSTKTAAGAVVVAAAAKAWRLVTRTWQSCKLPAPGEVRLAFQSHWTKAQQKAAIEKLRALSAAAHKGELKKTLVVRDPTAASVRFKRAGNAVPEGHDVDHTIDLQLGGRDDLSNMKPLDATVNASFGKQIEARIRDLPYGAAITAVTVCF